VCFQERCPIKVLSGADGQELRKSQIRPLSTRAVMKALRLLGLVTVAGFTVAQNTTSADAHCTQGQYNWVRSFRSAVEKSHGARCSIR